MSDSNDQGRLPMALETSQDVMLPLRKTMDCSSVSSQAPSSSSSGSRRVRRKPIPIKGHKKSRNGCLTCRSRRVKCSERFPECASCARLNLPCEWPETLKAAHMDAVEIAARTEATMVRQLQVTVPQRIPSPTLSTPLRTTPCVLSMEDLRLFHHFLFTAHPPLPLGGEDIWRNISTMAHSVSVCSQFLSPFSKSTRGRL